MKIDSDRLRILRKKKGFTRPQLKKLSGITERTIQRLEREPHQSQKTREDTVNSLAKALSVEPGVLTGELPLPESDDNDLFPIRHRKLDSPTTSLNADMGSVVPRSLTWHRSSSRFWPRAVSPGDAKKLKEADEAIRSFDDIDGFWRSDTAFSSATTWREASRWRRRLHR